MAELTPKQKLDEAIQDYVREMHGSDSIVRTDYILSVAGIDIHADARSTFYYHAESGPMHALAGLAFMRDEEIKMLNREEANATDN